MPKNEAERFSLWKPLGALGEAVRFLTVLPVPGAPALDEAAITRSMAAFPLVGLLLGVLGAAAGWLASFLWGFPLHAIVVLVCWAVLTARLHLDGVADSCDGLFSWRSRQRQLEIMKDSRIGTMGALGLIVVLLLKIGALLSLGEAWWLGAVLAPVWGRWADIYGIFWFPVASADGLARTFRQQVRHSDFALATLFSLGVSLALNFPWGGVVLLVIGPVIHLCARAMVRTLGGLTGDTYGALCELGEVLTLVFLPPSIISNCFSTRLFGWH